MTFVHLTRYRHRRSLRHPGPALASGIILSLGMVLCGSTAAQTPDNPATPATEAESCRPLTDKAMAADMKAVLAQSQNMDLVEQTQLFNATVTLWSQVMNQCEGHTKDRAQRNLTDIQKMQAALAEQWGAGPNAPVRCKTLPARHSVNGVGRKPPCCSAKRNTCGKPPPSAAPAASKRRPTAGGSNQESTATTPSTAPLFEKAREQTQELRTGAAGLSREGKQDASQVTETSWREAATSCTGAIVQESARNNAQAFARERGAPWVTRVPHRQLHWPAQARPCPTRPRRQRRRPPS